MAEFIIPTLLSAGASFGVTKLMQKDKPKSAAPASRPLGDAAIASEPTTVARDRRGAGIAAGTAALQIAPLGSGGGVGASGGSRTTLLGR